MGRPLSKLPRGAPSSFRVADALEHGIPRNRLYRQDLRTPHHGLRALGPAPAAERMLHEAEASGTPHPLEVQREVHIERMREYIPLLADDAYFCGPSAALAWGIPLPPRAWDELHIGVPRPLRAPRRAGISGHQHSAGYVAVTIADGLPVTDPASTWATLGGLLGEDDLVAAADRVLRIPRMPGGFRALTEVPLAARAQLEMLAERKGRPGAPRLRAALELACTAASSPPETRIRLLMHRARLPEPALDYDVYDDSGRFLGCSELAYPELKVAIEYESDGHLTRTQLQCDIDKYQAYSEAGWTVVRLTSEHVFTSPREALRRIRQALCSARP